MFWRTFLAQLCCEIFELSILNISIALKSAFDAAFTGGLSFI